MFFCISIKKVEVSKKTCICTTDKCSNTISKGFLRLNVYECAHCAHCANRCYYCRHPISLCYYTPSLMNSYKDNHNSYCKVYDCNVGTKIMWSMGGSWKLWM